MTWTMWSLCATCTHETTGSVVSPTAAAVQSASNEVTNKLTSSFLSPDIFNGNLSTSWPLCLTNYIVIYQSRNSSDCSYMQSLLAFIAWSQLNPHTFSKVQDLGYSPLPFGFKTYPLPPLSPRARNDQTSLTDGRENGCIRTHARTQEDDRSDGHGPVQRRAGVRTHVAHRHGAGVQPVQHVDELVPIVQHPTPILP
jgi:hypothetical protein